MHFSEGLTLTRPAGKLFTLLRAFPAHEPTRRRFANEAVAWTAQFGSHESGDPDLHHVIGTLYAEGMPRRLSPPAKLTASQTTSPTTQSGTSH